MFSMKCKVCIEKDHRIEDLLNQVAFLRHLTSPQPSLENKEVNQILNGSHEVIEYPVLTNEQLKEQELLYKEANSILMGTY